MEAKEVAASILKIIGAFLARTPKANWPIDSTDHAAERVLDSDGAPTHAYAFKMYENVWEGIPGLQARVPKGTLEHTVTVTSKWIPFEK